MEVSKKYIKAAVKILFLLLVAIICKHFILQGNFKTSNKYVSNMTNSISQSSEELSLTNQSLDVNNSNSFSDYIKSNLKAIEKFFLKDIY